MKAWQMQKLGDPWEDLTCNKVNLPAVSDAVCRVQVEAADLNFADILQCQGNYQVRLEPPFTPGMNAAGTVMEAGENSQFKPGDKIVGPCYKTSGGYAEECLIAAKGANLLPEGVDPMLAAAIHVTYGTGWFGLHLRGELQPSDAVLVLAGAGGVGSHASSSVVGVGGDGYDISTGFWSFLTGSFSSGKIGYGGAGGFRDSQYPSTASLHSGSTNDGSGANPEYKVSGSDGFAVIVYPISGTTDNSQV